MHAFLRKPAAIAAAFCSALIPSSARAQVAPATSAPTAPDYSKYTESYHVPFSNKVDFKQLRSMNVRVSINGGPPMSFQVDTGSVGVIVSADSVTNIDPNAPKGSIKYSSSGIELDGVWTTVTLTFPDSKDAAGHVATAILPILAVTSGQSTGVGVNAGAVRTMARPHPHMFGVGFGRGADAHPERNPFINLNEMQAGTMRKGYTITRDGYTLGLTAAGVGTGYTFQPLKERTVTPETATMKPGLKDWETAPGSVTVGAVTSPTGTVLMDTGLTNMMIAIPGHAAGTDVAAGTPVTMHLLGGQLDYAFNVGDTASPLAPRRVTWINPTHGAYVNTGLRALSAFDYLYDADGGYLALRPVK